MDFKVKGDVIIKPISAARHDIVELGSKLIGYIQNAIAGNLSGVSWEATDD